jgi:hypothetical protein
MGAGAGASEERAVKSEQRALMVERWPECRVVDRGAEVESRKRWDVSLLYARAW